MTTELRTSILDSPRAVQPLEASRALQGTGAWGAIAEVDVLGDSLFVYDLYGPPTVTVLDRASGGVIGTFGRKGGGPGEFRDIGDIFRDRTGPGRFWVLDRTARRISQYGPGDSGWVGLLRTFPLEVRGQVRSIRVLDGSLVVGGIFEGGSPVIVTDPTGQRVRERYGRYPAHAPGDSLRTDLMVNLPLVSHHPDGSRMVLAYRHFNLLQFYDIERGRVTSITGPDPFEPRPEDLMELNPKKFAYGKVRSTERYVYALFCGCTNADRRSQLLRLQVFTWDGQVVTVVPVERRLWHWVFDVSPDDRILYMVVDDPYPQVLEVPLPPKLSSGPTTH